MWHCPFKGLCKSFKKWLDSPQFDTAGNWLRAVSYCGETDSVQYDTARGQSRKTQLTWWNLDQNWKYLNSLLSGSGRLELWKKQVTNSPFKWDLEKSHDSPQYDTVGRLTQRSIMLGGVWLSPEKFELLGENFWKYFNPLVSGPSWFEWWKKMKVENLVGLSL